MHSRLPADFADRRWRKARWTDAEPVLSFVLDLLPLLPVCTRQAIWNHWANYWEELSQSTLSQNGQPFSTVYPEWPQLLFRQGPQRRKLDAVPFAATLVAQLAQVSSEHRTAWARQVLAFIPFRNELTGLNESYDAEKGCFGQKERHTLF